ncbi:MAG: putative toxin-antitoxin system toxin component, PIN family [Kiritimatiellae bacterium]|nr:putative toxin-antitoxin system toxin component, PIN family [Kiritimatiellia bacterium]
MFRVVLDANIVISALIRPDSAPGRILRAAVDGAAVRMVTSGPLLDELGGALAYRRLQRHLKMDPQEREAFVVLLEQISDPVRIADYPPPGICRDPKDEPYLQTALAGRADFIVSGDNDLLVLMRIEQIPIVNAAAFEHVLHTKV